MQPAFKIGDKVLLRHDNMSTTAPLKKLASEFLGPFPIISKLSNVVYRLKLLSTLYIYDIFHVFVLEKYHQITIRGQRQKPPPQIVIP